jgi:hypothetical protein
MRTECMNNRYVFDCALPVNRLLAQLGNKMQISTQRYDRRPFGVGLLVAGYDVSLSSVINCVPEIFVPFFSIEDVFTPNLRFRNKARTCTRRARPPTTSTARPWPSGLGPSRPGLTWKSTWTLSPLATWRSSSSTGFVLCVTRFPTTSS